MSKNTFISGLSVVLLVAAVGVLAAASSPAGRASAGAISSVAYASNGEKLFACNPEGLTRRDPATGAKDASVGTVSTSFNSIAVNRSGGYVALANSNDTVTVFDGTATSAQSPKMTLRVKQGEPNAIAFDFSTDDMVIGTTKGKIVVSSNFGEFGNVGTAEANVSAVMFNPINAHELAYSSANQNQWGVCMMDRSSGHKGQTYCGDVACVESFDISSDGKWIVAGGHQGQDSGSTNKVGRVKCSKFETASESGKYDVPWSIDPSTPVLHVSISKDGDLVAYSLEREVHVCNLADHSEVRSQSFGANVVQSICFDHLTNGRLAVGLDNSTVSIMNISRSATQKN